MNFFNLNRQYKLINQKIFKSLSINFKNCDFIQGKNVKALEKYLLKFSKSKYCLSCANGTDALRIALNAINIPKNSYVIVPSYTWISTASSVVESGMKPIFCDVDENDYLISVEKINETLKFAKKNKMNVKAIITVDLFGNPVDYKKISKLCKKNKIFFISDAAQSFGSKHLRNYIGTYLCDIMTTSFFPTKNLGCYGDGGAIFFDKKKLFQKAKNYSKNGQGNNGKIVSSGINSRLDTIQSTILLEKIKLLAQETILKKRIFLLYKRLLNNDVFKFQKINKDYESSYSVMTLCIAQKFSRNLFLSYLKKEKIPFKIYYGDPLHKSKFYKKYPMLKMKNTEKLSKTTISLPIFPYLKINEIQKICKKINLFFN
tara:strand:- start:861 stop:1979 length:1119 start_codon:yes stop_codon:yes gene_type:complete